MRVLVLHRPIPPRATRLRDAPRRRCAPWPPSRGAPSSTASTCATCRFLAPPRSRSYGSWGAWAAPTLAAALRRLRAEFPYDLVHAHNAVPGGRRRAARARARAAGRLGARRRRLLHRAAPSRRRARRAPRLRRRAARAGQLGRHRGRGAAPRRARDTRVVRLGTDVPEQPAHKDADPTLVTVAHLVARKRHADVVRALWLLRERHPQLRYLIVGDGPEREPLARLAARARAWPTASSSPASCRARRRWPARAPGTCSSCPASTRPSASPTSRPWPPGCRRSARAARPARRRSRPRATACASSRPPTSRRWRPSSTRCWPSPPTCSSSAPARARPSCARLHLGALRARDGAGLRGRAAVSAGRSSSSPTTSRPTAPARSARCTSAWRSSSRSSAGARTTRPPGSTTPACPSAASRQREVHALAASGRYARRRVRDGRARRAARRLRSAPSRARRPVRALERAVGRPAARPAHLAARPLLRRIHRRAAVVVGYGPHVTAYARRLGARARRASRPQAVDNAFWATPVADAGAARRSPRCSSGATCPRRASPCCVEAWRRALPLADGPPRGVVGADRRGRAPRRSATPTPRADVLVIPSLATTPLPRAVGARRQRSHEPAPPRHRHRRRRRRRRRARAPRAQRPRRPAPATPTRSPARCARLHDDPALRARLGANAARDVAPPTPTPPGPTASPRPCAARPRQELPC